MALGSTQPLTEMSTRNISWGWKRPMLRADKLTTFMYRLSWNLGDSSSWKPQGLSRPVMGLLYFTLYTLILPKKIHIIPEQKRILRFSFCVFICSSQEITFPFFLFGKGPHPLLFTGLRSARVKITINGEPNLPNYREVFIIYNLKLCDCRQQTKTWRAVGCTTMHITHHRPTLIILMFSTILMSKNFSI